MNRIERQRKYMKYCALATYFGSCASTVSASSVIKTLGFNETFSSVYFGKDIIGQLGGLLYVSSTKSSVVKTSKQFSDKMLKGSTLQFVGNFIENCAPLCQNSLGLLSVLGASNLSKNLSYIIIGSLNAVNIQKLANSTEDLEMMYSKVTCYNTISASMGTLTGLGIVSIIPSYTVRGFVCLPLLYGLNSYFLKKATEISHME